MLEFNIAPNTQIGRIDINHQVHIKENPYRDDKYSRGGDFLDNLASDSIIEFSHRWLHLADFKEMLTDVDEFIGYDIGKFGDMYYNNSPIIPMKKSAISPLVFNTTDYKPVIVTDDMPNITYEELIAKGGL